MKRIICLVFALLFFVFCGSVSAGGPIINSYRFATAGNGYTQQDFTTYTLVSDGITPTITSSTISWVDLTRNETTYVYKDFGAGYFSGDFTHRFKVVYDNPETVYGLAYNWRMSQALSGDVDYIGFYSYGTPAFYLESHVGGSGSSFDSMASPVAGTTYYVTITRDDDAGANGTGQLKAYICTTDYCTSGANLQDTLTLDMHAGEQNDYRYLEGLRSSDVGNATKKIDGSTSDMEIKDSLP